MNQLTTIAALPSGGGCMGRLPVEVGNRTSARVEVSESDRELFARHGYRVNAQGFMERIEAAERQGFEPFEYTERS